MRRGGQPIRGARQINLDFIEAKVERALTAMTTREFHVIVVAEEVPTQGTEWRINIAPDDIEAYAAVGKVIARAHEIYETATKLGIIKPMRFTITIYAPVGSIIGSFD